MKRQLALLLCLALSLSNFAAGQTATEQADEVVRINVDLVQVDVTVTDNQGRLVTGLTAEDFELFEEGRPQKITHFSFVGAAPRPAPPATEPPSALIASSAPVGVPAPAPPPPAARLRREQVRRSMALVVDDLGLSQESSYHVRRALRKFVDEQMRAGDLVAIIRTGAGMGALQQFTSDRRLLHAAIERVRFNLASRSSVSTFAPIGGETLTKDSSLDPTPELLQRDPFASSMRQPAAELEQLREDLFSVGTLGALNFVVRGLRELPGRKSVILFSDGFRMYTRDPGNDRVRENLRRLTELANRASVVLYAIDPRGLQTFGITAADNLSGAVATGRLEGQGTTQRVEGDVSHREFFQDLEQRLSDRRRDFYETQHGLSYLAAQTGGFLIKNSNDIEGAVRRVLADQEGFYLLGYRPDDATFKPEGGRPRFRNIEVRVKRPGVRVRTRKGFYGFTDDEARRPAQRTAYQQLIAALTSPFQSGDIGLRMTALFGYDDKRGHFTQSHLYIDARDLHYTRTPQGEREARIHIMAVTFGDSGQVIDQDDRPYTVRVSEQDFQRAAHAGLVYTVTLPVKKPGAYQLRLAVRDEATSRIGSANQFIEVPDVKKGRLTLSGVTLRGTQSAAPEAGQTGATERNAATTPAVSPAQGPDLTDPLAGPAGRQLRRGMVLHYGFFIYNAQLDKATRRPRLSTQVRLFRDGRLVYTGQLRDYRGEPSPDGRRLVAGGSLRVGRELGPGEYVLQVVAVDHLAKGDRQLATQWIDFDVVE